MLAIPGLPSPTSNALLWTTSRHTTSAVRNMPHTYPMAMHARKNHIHTVAITGPP